MKADMEDYQYELSQYEKQQLKRDDDSHQGPLRPPTVAVDLGTCFTKFAVATTRVASPSLEVMISREGDRSVFNGIVYDSSDGTTVSTAGRTALDRFFYYHNVNNENDSRHGDDGVTLPFTILTAEAASLPIAAAVTGKQVVTDFLTPRLAEVLDRMEIQTSKQAMRQVVTLPSAFMANTAVYQQAFAECCDAPSFVPEPVAAVWGAQFYNILPDDDDPSKDASYLVVDIGGFTTQIAVVQKNIVRYSNTLPWGGESVIEQLVHVLKQPDGAFANHHQQQPIGDARSLALLQVQARQAVTELSTQTRVTVHVPYVFADPANHHLDAIVSRPVLEQAVEQSIRDQLLDPDFLHAGDYTSPHLAVPTNLTSLWTSVLTQVLDRAGTSPTSTAAVLLVGGGARIPFAQQTLQLAWNRLAGNVHENQLKRIDPSVQSELTVLGAATLPPSFDYSVTEGLVRR